MELSQKQKATLYIGWTTFSDRESARAFAVEIIKQALAVCVQLEGPITSIYKWDDKIESATEFRLMIKFLPSQLQSLENYLHRQHSYETPEWVTVEAIYVSPKYRQWALKNIS